MTRRSNEEDRDMARATHYPGPLSLADAKTKLIVTRLTDDAFHREGPRANVEYRDLGLAAATGGRIGAKHIRAIKPFEKETGWHWHDMTGHFVYVLKGWLKFRFEGIPDDVVVEAGSCISQPAGVPHNVIGQSDDLEVIEINLPAEFSTIELTR
jgi:mannose-6-phosphate isomerase-like protein (cupin superfamily)